MNVVLIGFMATGKTAVGRLLAERLGWAFHDTDEMIEKQTGCSVADLFAKAGEEAFRGMERQAVRLVSLLDKTVIATGGGVPLDADNMRELSRAGRIVLLTARPEAIVDRLRDQWATRPLLKKAKDPEAEVRALLADREKAYGRAHHSVATDGLSPEQVAGRILALLQ